METPKCDKNGYSNAINTWTWRIDLYTYIYLHGCHCDTIKRASGSTPGEDDDTAGIAVTNQVTSSESLPSSSSPPPPRTRWKHLYLVVEIAVSGIRAPTKLTARTHRGTLAATNHWQSWFTCVCPLARYHFCSGVSVIYSVWKRENRAPKQPCKHPRFTIRKREIRYSQASLEYRYYRKCTHIHTHMYVYKWTHTLIDVPVALHARLKPRHLCVTLANPE